MAAPNPFSGNLDREFTDFDWKQTAALMDPGGGENFSGDGGGDTIIAVTKVPFNKLQAFHRYCLGWQGCSGGGSDGIVLQRTLPKRHPIYAEMAAYNTHATAFRTDNRASQGSPLVGLKRYTAQTGAIPYFTGYIRAKAQVGFKDLDYDLLEDGELDTWSQSYEVNGQTVSYSFPAEWQRFTSFDPAPRVEALSLDGFTMRYAEGSGNTSPTTNPKQPPPGGSTPAPVGQLLVKADLAITTWALPQEFLFGTQSILPRNVLVGLGKVNKFEIFNQKAGTLLFIGCEMSKRRFTLRVQGDNTNVGRPETKYLWKCRYLFTYFNPPKGINDDQSYYSGTKFGHNCLFWLGARGQDGAILEGDKNSMKWFFATASGDPNDPGLLPEFDIAQLWRPVGNTSGSLNPVYGGNYQYGPWP